MDNTAINRARIVYYGLFSCLFSFRMGREQYDTIVRAVNILHRNSIDEQSEKALDNIKRRLKKGGFEALEQESNRVFFSPTTAFVPMTASFYHEQRDDGKKRVEMIDYLLQSKFRRNTNTYKEHEDHIEFVMQFLQKLIEQEVEGDASAGLLARKVFANILNPMVDDFADNLFRHDKSFLYKQAVLALRSFIDCERLYLNIPKPENSESRTARKIEQARKKEQTHTCVQFGTTGCA